MAKAELPLFDLSKRHMGLTDAIAEYYIEAASVCLDRHHISPADIEIENAGTKIQASTEWTKPDEKIKHAWANEIDTTEAGACACVLAAVELTDGLVAVHSVCRQNILDNKRLQLRDT